MMKIDYKIEYEDEDILICYKPAGLPVQSARVGTMDLESALRQYLSSRNGRRDPSYLAVIHRLDQPVEGILVFAKTPEAAKELNRQMVSHEMEKKYLAVVDGIPQKTEGRLVDELEKDRKSNLSRVVLSKTAGSKTAVLSYCLEKTVGERSLLSIWLRTGRHHQIRVQLSHAGLPLAGDTKYNPKEKERDGWRQLGLCAVSLSFTHPGTRKKFTWAIQPQGEIFQFFLAL